MSSTWLLRGNGVLVDSGYVPPGTRYGFEKPMSGAAVLSQYWMLKLGGDDAGATKIYQQAVAEGVPLPGR